MADLKSFIAKVADGRGARTGTKPALAFGVMMSGDATPSQIGGFLMALRVRGESVDEIYGAVSVMREKMLPVKAPADAVDIVGTGGDASGTYNVSTAAAFIAAGAGVKVAKHGNRALSSKSGTADSLSQRSAFRLSSPRRHLGLHRRGWRRLHVRTGTSFRHAPCRAEPRGARHPHHLQPAGPAVQPCRGEKATARRLLAGLARSAGQVLKDLGSETVWVVHGDGLDEMTTTGPTQVVRSKTARSAAFRNDAGRARPEPGSLAAAQGRRRGLERCRR
jgi:anthranilate phosphoribosyltransferase